MLISVPARCQRDGFLDKLELLVLLDLLLDLDLQLDPGLEGVAVLPDELVDDLLLEPLHLHRALLFLQAITTPSKVVPLSFNLGLRLAWALSFELFRGLSRLWAIEMV